MSVRAIWPVATEGAEIGFLMNTRDTTIPDMIRKLVFLFLFFIPYQLQFFSVFGCISIFFRGLLLSRVIVSLSRFKLYSNTPTQDVDWTSVITSSTEKHMQKDVCMCVCMRRSMCVCWRVYATVCATFSKNCFCISCCDWQARIDGLWIGLACDGLGRSLLRTKYENVGQ